MSHPIPRHLRRHRDRLRRLAAGPDFPFGDVLTRGDVEAAVRAANLSFRVRLFTPAVTLWAFLVQILEPKGACRDAVLRVLAWLVGKGHAPCSTDTGAYCRARQRLPESLLAHLAKGVAARTQDAPAPALWKGHAVRVVDGTTVSMPDTPANQAAFPQTRRQQPGLGFPLARLVVVFSLAYGCALEMALGRFAGRGQGEISLFRGLVDLFGPNDVVLGDSGFRSYANLALLRGRGAHYVGRAHGARPVDFRRGFRWGKGDHLTIWHKPRWHPGMGLTADVFAALPDWLIVREVRVPVTVPGFRVQRLVVVTTLLDAAVYTAADLADLYRDRWQAELDLRSLKDVLGMGVLRCKTPDMVRKELWMHVLAYNVIRGMMARAAGAAGVPAATLSFAAARSAWRAFAPQLHGRHGGRVWVTLLAAIGAERVANRPNRVEPRAVKRRPKAYPLLRKPRPKMAERTRPLLP